MALRVVLDTNVLIATALPRRRVARLRELWQQGRYQLLVSQPIFEEYLRVLTYPKFALSLEEIRHVVEQDLQPYLEYVQVTTLVQAIKEDPTDNMFLACAVDGRADVIVSGDRHLLMVKRFRGIPIETTSQFLTRFTPP